MPAQFTVHVDPDDLARQELAAAAVPVPTGTDSGADGPVSGSTAAEKRGSRDARLAARQRSEQARTSRAAGSGRSYAFRRS